VIHELDQEQINTLVHGKPLAITLGGEPFLLTTDDVEITRKVHEGWIAMNAGAVTIALDTELTDGLVLEGIARELVNKINTMRRQANFSVTDRVRVHLGTSEKVKQSLLIHGDYVREEVLAVEMDYEFSPDSTQWDINGEPTAIFIEKV